MDRFKGRGRHNDDEVQADPMLREGRASRMRTWMAVVAAAVLLTVVIYAMAQNSRPRVAIHSSDSATSTGKGADNAPLTQRSGANAPLVEPSRTGQ